MDRLIRLAAEIRLRRAMAVSFKEANEMLDKMSRQAKKKLGNV